MSDSGSELQQSFVPPTEEELLAGLQELRHNPKVSSSKNDANLLHEALQVPETGIVAWISTLHEDDRHMLSWEILSMDAELRSFHAVNIAQQLMTLYCRKLSHQQILITTLNRDLEAQKVTITQRDNQITLLQGAVAQGQADLQARDAIIAKRDSTIGLEELEITDLTAREKDILAKLSAKDAQATSQKELIEKIQTDAESSHTAVKQQADINTRLQSEIEAKSSVLATKDIEIAEKADIIVQREAEIKDLKSQIEKFRVEASRAKEVMDGLHKLAKKPEKK